jgi:hypothetical protein
MKRLAKMETILEEVYIEEPGPVLVLDDWKTTWHSAREHDPYESHWDQWVDIEYADEPSISPPPMYKVTTA